MNIQKNEIEFLVKELYKIDFFSKLSTEEVDTVLEKFYKHTFKKGATIVPQGKPGRFFAVIFTGKVKVTLKQGFLRKKVLAELEAGHYFGEISLLSDEPTTASIIASEKTEVFLLNRTDFKHILASNCQLAAKIRSIAENRLIEASF